MTSHSHRSGPWNLPISGHGPGRLLDLFKSFDNIFSYGSYKATNGLNSVLCRIEQHSKACQGSVYPYSFHRHGGREKHELVLLLS